MTAARTLGDLAPYMTGNVTTNSFTYTSTQSFLGNSNILASVVANMAENATISASACTGNVTVNVCTQSVILFTSNATTNWSFNFQGSSSTSVNSLLTTGQSLTVALMVNQGSTAYLASNIRIDGSTVTPKWQGGSAPTAGNANSVDVYAYTIIKTADAVFNVFASQTQFA
jgi:hypothetical protein